MNVERENLQHESEFEDSYEDLREIRGTRFSDPLAVVPRRPLVTVDAKDPVRAAIAAMNSQHTGCALVTRGGRLVGIFTERDVLRKIVGGSVDLDKTLVESVMTTDPDTLPESASVAFALRSMSEEGYRHIPLVDADGRPTGVVAVRDIVAWIVSKFPDSVFNLPPEHRISLTPEGG